MPSTIHLSHDQMGALLAQLPAAAQADPGFVFLPDAPVGGVPATSGTLTIPAEWQSAVAAADVSDLPHTRATMIASAQAHYTALIAAGFTFGGILYAIDPATQVRVGQASTAATATLVAGSAVTWPSNFVWAAASGAPQAMTAVQMLALGNTLFHFVAACDAHLAAILAEIVGAGTVAAVAAIDVAAGYPAAQA